jgi:conjugative relaxase-like TrwC/TraI family protein
VLSIGKLVAGQARYYLDQAEGRVDAVESIGAGIEDYYAGGSEARGVWGGSAARALGLHGSVDGKALRRALAGRDPWSDEPLRDSRSCARVAGFDLTFSAPKSVSVVFGLADPAIRAAVRDAHDLAVTEALGYLERSAAAVRRGRGGTTVQRADGLVAAAFRHRTSRVGDPQLHTHVLVANLGRGPDRRWSALDGRRLYAHARTASFVYQAVLRGELARSLGLGWTPVRDGIAEVDGVPREVMRMFSRRRADIEAALLERGSSGPRAAEAAALATRGSKSSLDGERLAEEWRRRAESLGFDAVALQDLLGRAMPRALEARTLPAVQAELAGPAGLTHRCASFSRRSVIRELAERLPAGATITAEQLERMADAFLASDRVVPLLPRRQQQSQDALRLRDGRPIPTALDERRYSTPELFATEQRIVDTVLQARRRGGQLSAAVEAAVAARPSLSTEQQAMVREVCRRDTAVTVVAGRAGTGKTFALAAAREAWEADGTPVRGAAVARRAARELEDGAGISSTSVAALLAGGPLPSRVLLVVDEAGMVGTRQLAAIVERVRAADGKLVLVGDHRQLPEIEAGGAFRGLVQRGAAVELRENRRQRHAWERAALDDLREGRAEEAVARYRGRGRLVAAREPAEARRRLVADWYARDGLMIAARRADVAELNRLARDRLREAGGLRGPEVVLPGGHFAVGDRVVVRRNERRSGLSNGDRAVVQGVDAAACRLELECGGRRVIVGPEFLLTRTAHGDPPLQHGYAVTIHVAQGMTVDRAYVLGHGLSRESGYTALSRGRDANYLYVVDEIPARGEFAPAEATLPNAVERLVQDLQRSTAESLAIDTGEPVAALGRQALAAGRAERRATREESADRELGIDR